MVCTRTADGLRKEWQENTLRASARNAQLMEEVRDAPGRHCATNYSNARVPARGPNYLHGTRHTHDTPGKRTFKKLMIK